MYPALVLRRVLVCAAKIHIPRQIKSSSSYPHRKMRSLDSQVVKMDTKSMCRAKLTKATHCIDINNRLHSTVRPCDTEECSDKHNCHMESPSQLLLNSASHVACMIIEPKYGGKDQS